jgi:hypothetical protein
MKTADLHYPKPVIGINAPLDLGELIKENIDELVKAAHHHTSWLTSVVEVLVFEDRSVGDLDIDYQAQAALNAQMSHTEPLEETHPSREEAIEDGSYDRLLRQGFEHIGFQNEHEMLGLDDDEIRSICGILMFVWENGAPDVLRFLVPNEDRASLIALDAGEGREAGPILQAAQALGLFHPLDIRPLVFRITEGACEFREPSMTESSKVDLSKLGSS